MATDAASEISDLVSKLASVEAVLDPDAMRKEADSLRERSADPDLWSDQEQAQAVNRRLSYLEGELSRLSGLRRRLDDVSVMFELAESEHDETYRDEALRDLAGIRKEIDQLEVRTLLSGEYDAREALISINAGAGGADAADWAEGLQRIYLRWAERHGYPTEIYDTSYAEEAGIKSTTFGIKAPYAYGTLRGELERRLNDGKPVVLEIEVQGARQIRETMPEAVQVFIAPPSRDALRARLVGRGTDSPEQVDERLRTAERELEAQPEFGHVVVNDRLEQATGELVGIVQQALE